MRRTDVSPVIAATLPVLVASAELKIYCGGKAMRGATCGELERACWDGEVTCSQKKVMRLMFVSRKEVKILLLVTFRRMQLKRRRKMRRETLPGK